jgi:hypothetical protein
MNMEETILESLIGMTTEDGIIFCDENNYDVRVVREDYNNSVITSDLCLYRVNLEIDNGIITKYDIG